MEGNMAEVTGRDAVILAKALAYAIEAIERLPPDWREESDCADMKTLLDHFAGVGARFTRMLAAGHIQRRGIGCEDGKLVLRPRNTKIIPIN
jgi:hypothetical protein